MIKTKILQKIFFITAILLLGILLTTSVFAQTLVIPKNAPSNKDIVVFDGTIKISQKGRYIFSTQSNGKSTIRINGKIVLTNIGTKPSSIISGKSTQLTKGAHKIKVTYNGRAKTKKIKIYWKGPNFARKQIHSNVLTPTKPSNQNTSGGGGGGGRGGNANTPPVNSPVTPTAPTDNSEGNTTTTTNPSSATVGAYQGVITHFASPNGTGNGLSISSPFTIADFWSVAKPGDTLGLLNGTYRGQKNMINPPEGLSGEQSKPITVVAINDGLVEIDGEKKYAPVYLEKNNWFHLIGFDAKNAGGSEPSVSVIELKYSSNNTVERVIGRNAGDGNSNIFGAHNGENNSFIDVAGWGTARKIFSNSQQGNNTRFTRAFARWEGSHVEGPKKAFTLSYNSYGALCENCIAMWDGLQMQKDYELKDYYGNPLGIFYNNYQPHNPEGIFSHDGFDVTPDVANIRLLGSIAFITGEHRFHNSTRKWAGPFSFDIKGMIIENIISIIEPGSRDDIMPVNFGDEVTPAINKIKNMTVIGRGVKNISNAWSQEAIYKSNSCNEIVANGGSVVNPKPGSITGGAKIMKRYENGVLTNQDLWPWPMNERIIKAMQKDGYTKPVNVTKTIFELCGGTLPSDLNSSNNDDNSSNEDNQNDDDQNDQTGGGSNNTAVIVQKAKDWLAGNASVRAQLEAELKNWKTNIESVIAQVRPNNFNETKTGEIFYQNFKIQKFANKYPGHQYHMYVPSHYDPSKPMGLILWLHGGGSWYPGDIDHLAIYDMDNELVTGRSGARTETDKSNYILVAPIAPFGSLLPHPDHASRWNINGADQYLLDVITEVQSRYNVDSNKVVLAGFSMGGIGAYHNAIRLNDRLAAVMASAGSWELGSWDALINTPLYIIHGTFDAYFNSQSDCRPHNTDIAYARYARDLVQNGVLVEYPAGHGWDDVGQNGWVSFINGTQGWVTNKTRDPYTKKVIAINPWRSYDVDGNYGVEWTELPSPHTSWVSIYEYGTGKISYDYAQQSGQNSCASKSAWESWKLTKTKKDLPGGKATAEITGANKISVSTQNVKKMSLWLSPQMVDTTKPVAITVNGTTKNYTCSPSLLDALRSYERRSDWEVYQCEVPLDL